MFSRKPYLMLLAMCLLLGACRSVLPPDDSALTAPPTSPETHAREEDAAETSPTSIVVAAEPSASPVAPPKLSIEHQTIVSEALAGNLLGDPVERGMMVVLPSDYATSTQRYPVVYILHWYPGDEYSDSMDFMMEQTKALTAGNAKEMIFVAVNATNRFGGSMYLSSPTIGDYETYLTKEVVAYIDANYRTIADRTSRGITGCSMGGDGTMHLALKYPDVYGAAAPISGIYDWLRDPVLEKGRTGFPGELTELDQFKSLQSGDTKYEIARAAGVASNPDNPPFYLDMPYIIRNGEREFAPGYLEKLEAASPVGDAKKYARQSARLEGILVYHGVYDVLSPVEVVRDFSALLTELGIEHEYLEAQVTHCPTDLQPVLQFMYAHLNFGEP